MLLFSALFSSFLNPFRSVGRGYTSAEEKPPEETATSGLHAMRIIPIIETLFHTSRAFNCCLLFQHREIPSRYRDFNASDVARASFPLGNEARYGSIPLQFRFPSNQIFLPPPSLERSWLFIFKFEVFRSCAIWTWTEIISPLLL